MHNSTSHSDLKIFRCVFLGRAHHTGSHDIDRDDVATSRQRMRSSARLPSPAMLLRYENEPVVGDRGLRIACLLCAVGRSAVHYDDFPIVVRLVHNRFQRIEDEWLTVKDGDVEWEERLVAHRTLALTWDNVQAITVVVMNHCTPTALSLVLEVGTERGYYSVAVVSRDSAACFPPS